MKLIVGLGNPGKEYEGTRHNAGFLALDNYLGVVKWKEKFNALYYETRIFEEKILFIKPTTYMNLSGNALREFIDYYDIDINDILIIYDDLDLEIGDYKIKTDSSSGGHNGIKSIIAAIGTQKFNRLKFGISKLDKSETKDYVLGKFSKEEKEKLGRVLDTSKEIINSFIDVGIDKTMNIYNTKRLED